MKWLEDFKSTAQDAIIYRNNSNSTNIAKALQQQA